MLCGEEGIRLRLHVEGRSRLPEADVCDILLAPSLQLVDTLGMLAGAEDHHAGGERVECTRMPYLELLDAEVAAGFAAELIDQAEGAPCQGLVEGNRCPRDEVQLLHLLSEGDVGPEEQCDSYTDR